MKALSASTLMFFLALLHHDVGGLLRRLGRGTSVDGLLAGDRQRAGEARPWSRAASLKEAMGMDSTGAKGFEDSKS